MDKNGKTITGLHIKNGKGDEPGAEIIQTSPDASSIGAHVQVPIVPGHHTTGVKIESDGTGTGLRIIQSGSGTGLKITVGGPKD